MGKQKQPALKFKSCPHGGNNLTWCEECEDYPPAEHRELNIKTGGTEKIRWGRRDPLPWIAFAIASTLFLTSLIGIMKGWW